MKELENYEDNEQVVRDTKVGPLTMLSWTFRRFRLPENEWRSPAFCAPVWHSLFQSEISLTSLQFRLGLRRFRYEVVSTLRMHAIRIFSITDIMAIDNRDASAQVNT